MAYPWQCHDADNEIPVNGDSVSVTLGSLRMGRRISFAFAWNDYFHLRTSFSSIYQRNFII